MNNKEYRIRIPEFNANGLIEALIALEEVEKILIKHAVGGHFEEEFNDSGIEVEINPGVDYDTSKTIVEKFAGIRNQVDDLKDLIDKPFDITKPIKSPWVSERDLIDLHEQEQKDEDDNYNN